MRIRVLSDLHLEIEDWRPPIASEDIVVLAGDVHTGTRGLFWAREHFPHCPVLYVPGNHEFYKQAYPRLLDKLRDAAQDTEVEILENQAHQFMGVTFLGSTLWTDFALLGNPTAGMIVAGTTMNDYRRIRRSPSYSRLRPDHTRGWHRRSVRFLEEHLGTSETTVVVTHHAPSARSIPDIYRDGPYAPAYASDLEWLVEEYSPALWIHGHLHTACDYRLGSTRVLANPRGYPDEPQTGFQPELVVEIEEPIQR